MITMNKKRIIIIVLMMVIPSIILSLVSFSTTKLILNKILIEKNDLKRISFKDLKQEEDMVRNFQYSVPSLEEIKDEEKPVITFKKTIYCYVGKTVDLLKNVSVSDNSGEAINATVEGVYDYNTIGAYKLKYVAVDSNNNRAEENFTLRVIEKTTTTTQAPAVAAAPQATSRVAITNEIRQKIVGIAASQVGNKGGKPYWSWYGFRGRVEWCATFISWVANQVGILNTNIPKFAGCGTGKNWFVNQGKWKGRGYVPQPGDVIFFTWSHNGRAQHVGFVESSDGVNVYTIEGNSSDKCLRRSYPINSPDILGYGLID